MSDGKEKPADRIDWELSISELRERIAEHSKSNDKYRANEAKKILDILLVSYAERWGDDYPLQKKDEE